MRLRSVPVALGSFLTLTVLLAGCSTGTQTREPAGTARATSTGAPSPTGRPAAPTATEPEPTAANGELDQDRLVLAISVDGLNADAIRSLGRAGAPAFWRLLDEGTGTLNARTEFEQTVTLPNHTSMLTGRPIDPAKGGHGVRWDDDRPELTVQDGAGHPVASVFTVVSDAGGTTALLTTKDKFELYDRSWPQAIDDFEYDDDQTALVARAVDMLRTKPATFTFLHVSRPDHEGHAHSGMSPQYLAAVHTTDLALGTILEAVDRDADLRKRLVVILTADHGFATGLPGHTRRTLAENYRVPFLVWGAGVGHHDLYDLNPDYRDPGRGRPAYAAGRQPVRNGALGNLAASVLGLGPIPGSTINPPEHPLLLAAAQEGSD